MTHYATGRRFEWKCRDDLFDNGYEVIRAAGSKGGSKVDLIALKPGQLLFVQCKATGTLPPGEWDRLVEVSGWVGAVPLLAANGPRGRGVVYTQLLGVKRRGCRTQPCQPFRLDEIVEVAA
jgi:Holliday junction resolvase